MIPQVFVDLDGTLADFDAHYENHFGVRPSKVADNVDWAKVRSVSHFYRDMPMMPDWRVLWDFVCQLSRRPIILTGFPKSVPEAATDKREFVWERLGDIDVRTCFSKDKALQCRPGDILIDDWTKYQHLWLAAGGRWITHTSAESSVQQLLTMGIGI